MDDQQNVPPIHPSLPAGYRWMIPEEAEQWDRYFGVIQVRVGGTDDDPRTDLALPITLSTVVQ